MTKLSIHDHDRDKAGLTYVYPVISRRAGGLSIGINLNTNNACNWRCVYCQVPGLVFGNAPRADLALLERELRAFLADVLRGDFFARHVPAGPQTIQDVAISGNGEPTSCENFTEAVELVGRVLADEQLLGKLPIVLITNGSLVHKREVQRGLAALRERNGVVWYKLDSATEEGAARMNNSRAGIERSRSNLISAAALCPTWIQTMMLAFDGREPSADEQAAYLAFVRALVVDKVPVQGVLLYGLARESHQPEAEQLSALSRAWLEAFARQIEAQGMPVRLFV